MTRASATPVRLYGIPNCDTVKKARAWLQAQGREAYFHDFKKAGVPTDRLDAWVDALGWERLVNRQGTTWRRLDAVLQAAVVDAASAKRLMRAEPSVIKRPVVEWADGAVTVGFDAGDWSRR
ncbi:MAG TPA: arsenate reductase [Burkholderiaceae bacterium]|nr:arsenate reductase [Burkholderiaceae bacterium]